MNDPKYAEYIKTRKPSNPVFLKVFEEMNKNGELDNLDDDVALEKVVSTTERLLESSSEQGEDS